MNHTEMITLLQQAQQTKTQHDRKAFVEYCYEHFFTSLFLIARALSRDTAEAEDKLQDFFVEKLLMSNCIDAFPPQAKAIEPFLKVIFRNHLRTKWRQEKRYIRTHLHLDEEGWKSLRDQSDDEGYINYMKHLQVLCRQLAPCYQQLLQLKLERKSNQEIAAITGRTLNSVKSSLSRIKRKLRQMVALQKPEGGLELLRA